MKELAQMVALFARIKRPPRPGEGPGVRRIRITIRRVRRLLREATANGVGDEWLRILRQIADHGPEIQRAVIVWIDLIEVLVQSVEVRYGKASGSGRLKAQDVKAAVKYLLRSARFRIPSIPDYLQPLVIELAVDWSVDAVVLMLNRNQLWDEEVEERPKTLMARLRLVVFRLARATRPFWEPIVRLFVRLFIRIRNVPLSPALRQALQAVEREGLIANPGNLLEGIVAALVWVGTHRDQVVAAFQLVVLAIQEAEAFLSASGAEKKELARDLVWAVLEEMGFAPRSALLSAIVDAAIDGAIEAAVHLFNKRGAFTHRGGAI